MRKVFKMSHEHDVLSKDALLGYQAELRDTGTVVVAPGTLFTQDELARIDHLQGDIPEEEVRKGDANDSHSVFVKRIRANYPGCHPTNVNGVASAQIIELLEGAARPAALKKIFGASSQYVIRRCQMHRMVPGSFIGIHLDAASDPDFEYSVIVQLARDFEGGEFVVYPRAGETQVFRPSFGSVVITSCKYAHEVRPVRSGERRTLVYFHSGHVGANRRRMEKPNVEA
ncbi:2OG-Fe(II) oxygenase [Bradyrhizobium sp. STM 3562]|uniref:2OG-Fe(II) oxygenase n=1 Tax=Bradyrhizobium sp. STM 3562 TaxID=578924 RepID=UPI0038903F5E